MYAKSVFLKEKYTLFCSGHIVLTYKMKPEKVSNKNAIALTDK